MVVEHCFGRPEDALQPYLGEEPLVVIRRCAGAADFVLRDLDDAFEDIRRGAARRSEESSVKRGSASNSSFVVRGTLSWKRLCRMSPSFSTERQPFSRMVMAHDTS